jgi:la-related protein 1
MDSRGWIPISLLVSFNRVRHLTLDPQLVCDVLALSQVLEMRGDWVRMARGEWAQFVLPDAPVSTVEGVAGAEAVGGEDGRRGDTSQDQDREHGEDDGDVEEEEEEEEIEIVMDREVIRQPWMAPSSS